MNQRWVRNSFIYVLILVAVAAIFYTVWRPGPSGSDSDLSKIITMAKGGQIERIVVDGNNVVAEASDGQKYRTRKEPNISMVELLIASGIPSFGENSVPVVVKSPSGFNSLFGTLLTLLPLVFFGAIILFMMRQAQGNSNQAMSFGKSRARMFVGNRPTVTFSDVAGVVEAKEELQEVVEFLKFPERFATLGARIPRGVLLVGPPGTGKTLMARAVAGEAGVPFFHISGSEFVEMFVGVGASRVRDLFDQAKRNAPCIIFIDEIDAVGRHRGAGLGGGHDEREQTLNQILVEMDGFDTSVNIIVIAATNRPDILDPALLRPGRFDRRVVMDSPDIKGRRSILDVHAKGKPFAPDVNLDIIARQTPGFSGADLANLINEAAILTARRNKKLITMDELEEAADRVFAGPERKSRVISVRQKEITAYHEAGHALVAYYSAHADPVHKISIVSRGNMGGYTRLLPEEDRFLYSRNQFVDMLAVSLGGRAAEAIVFGDITTGASNDLENATKIARRMVTEYGMSSSRLEGAETVPISTMISMAKGNRAKAIEVYGDDLILIDTEGKRHHARKEPDSSALALLERAGIETGPYGVDVQIKSAHGLSGLGPRTFGQRQELVFLGREISEQRDYGDRAAEEIDEEIRRLIDGAEDQAKGILNEHRDRLTYLAKELVVREAVEGDILMNIFKGEIPPGGQSPPPPPAPEAVLPTPEPAPAA